MSSAIRASFISVFLIRMPFITLCSSYLPVYAEIQEPYVYLRSSQVVVRNLYLGVPTEATVTLINGTLLPTRFHWGKVREPALSAPEAHVEGTLPLRHPQNRCAASLPQPVLRPTVPRKAGPSKEQHIWSGFSLACLQGVPVPCLQRSLWCTQLDHLPVTGPRSCWEPR